MPDLGAAKYTLYTDNKPFDAGMAEAEGTAARTSKSISSKLSSVGKSMTSVGKKMTTHLTLPILGVTAASIDMATKYQASMDKIVALTDTSRKQADAWGNAFLKLGPALGKSPKELADGMFFVASAGFKGKQAMDILTASAKASAAGLGDTKTVADAATSAINAYGFKVLNGAQATDTMIAAVKAGKMDPKTLASSLGTIIAPAQAMGISFQDVVGNLAALSRVGISSQKGTTGLRAVMMTMLKPTKGTSDALKTVGLNAKDVMKMMSKEGLQKTLLDLKNKFHGNRTELAKLFPNVKALTTMMSLTGKNSKKAAAAIKEVHNSAGQTNRAFKIVSHTAEFKFHKALYTLQSLLIVIGKKLLPIVTAAVGWLTGKLAGLTTWFQNLSPFWKKVIGFAALFLAALGPLIWIVGTLIGVIGTLIGVYEAFAAVELLATGPIVVIILGIAALIAIFVLLYEKVGWIHKAVNAAFHEIMAVVGKAEQVIHKHMHGIMKVFNVAKTAIGLALHLVSDDLKMAVGVIGDLIHFVADVFQGKWGSAWHDIGNVFHDIWNGITNAFGDISAALWDPLRNVLNIGIGFINTAVDTLNSFIANIPFGPSWRIPKMGLIGGGGSGGGVTYGGKGKNYGGGPGTQRGSAGNPHGTGRGGHVGTGARVQPGRGQQGVTPGIANIAARAAAAGAASVHHAAAPKHHHVTGHLKIVNWETGQAQLAGQITDAIDQHDAFTARMSR